MNIPILKKSFCEETPLSLASNSYKIILFGDSNVGKTTLTHRFINGSFNPKLAKTYGVELKTSMLYVDNLAITLSILDFSGEPRFYPLFNMYCRGIDGGIYMFDMTNSDSVLHYDSWMERIYQNISPELPLFIVGCKSDLVEDQTLLEGSQQIQELMGAGHYYQCSAKSGENANEIFQMLIERIYYARKQNTISAIMRDLNSGKLNLDSYRR